MKLPFARNVEVLLVFFTYTRKNLASCTKFANKPTLLEQPCNKSDNAINLVTSC